MASSQQPLPQLPSQSERRSPCHDLQGPTDSVPMLPCAVSTLPQLAPPGTPLPTVPQVLQLRSCPEASAFVRMLFLGVHTPHPSLLTVSVEMPTANEAFPDHPSSLSPTPTATQHLLCPFPHSFSPEPLLLFDMYASYLFTSS